MPSLAQHKANVFTKLLLIGESKTGKTGSLVSLVKAGYKLRILDFDNLLDFLASRVQKLCPERMADVEYRSLRDKSKASDRGMVIDGLPQAWITAIKMFDKWKYDDVDLGEPATWGPDCILVIDSLSRMCDAAYDFHKAITVAGRSGDKDGRAIYGNAQNDVEKHLATITSKRFETNVIVIGHGTFQDVEGKTRIYPAGIGQKLNPKIPTYFPNYVMYKQTEDNEGSKRVIQLNSSASISLSNGNPDVLKGTLPVETGLATFFAALREQPKEKPTSLTLQRRIA